MKTRILAKVECPLCRKILSKRWCAVRNSLRVGRKHIATKHNRTDVEPVLHKIKLKNGEVLTEWD